MASAPDTTLLWCCERLIDADEIPDNIVDEFVGRVCGRSEIPPLIHARLCIRGLSNPHQLTSETALNICQQLEFLVPELVSQLPNPNILMPPADLKLMLRTDIVVDVWRRNPAASHEEVAAVAARVFNTSDSQSDLDSSRLHDLYLAAQNFNLRKQIEDACPSHMWMDNAKWFASAAKKGMPKTLLQQINEDINSQKYLPGQGATAPPPPPVPTLHQAFRPVYEPTGALPGFVTHQATAHRAAPAPGARGTSPVPAAARGGYVRRDDDYDMGDGGFASPPQLSSQRRRSLAAGRAQPGSLDRAMRDLKRAGGPDPLAGVLEQAGRAQQHEGNKKRRGVAVAWDSQDEEGTPSPELGPKPRMDAHRRRSVPGLKASKPSKLARDPASGGKARGGPRRPVDLKDKWRNLLRKKVEECLEINDIWIERRDQEDEDKQNEEREKRRHPPRRQSTRRASDLAAAELEAAAKEAEEGDKADDDDNDNDAGDKEMADGEGSDGGEEAPPTQDQEEGEGSDPGEEGEGVAAQEGEDENE